ncbi:hypothetical protein ACH5RR_033254 [Cinchona calisaya]|uniref:Bifunctional inhibitor/plant lipid transfer protein/seed storage helical domain-containing protein n=1 Tax=Cinchona calisaya TaxID=153742 RepID=A0ABD2YPU1_9GENT
MSNGMDTLWALTILICLSCQVTNAQIQGCSLLGIDIQECMNPDGSSASMESCCKTLNHAVQAGYYCLCLLFRSSPLLSITLSLQLSSCYISVPPLTQCQKSLPIFHTPVTTPEPALNNPPARPVPVRMPPGMPENLMQPSAPDDFMLPLPPKRDEIPRNRTSVDNSSVTEGQQISSSNLHPIPKPGYMKSSGGNKFKVLSYPRFLLPVALLATI